MSKATILVLEDDNEWIEIHKTKLNSIGDFTVVCYSDPTEAKNVATQDPNLVVAIVDEIIWVTAEGNKRRMLLGSTFIREVENARDAVLPLLTYIFVSDHPMHAGKGDCLAVSEEASELQKHAPNRTHVIHKAELRDDLDSQYHKVVRIIEAVLKERVVPPGRIGMQKASLCINLEFGIVEWERVLRIAEIRGDLERLYLRDYLDQVTKTYPEKERAELKRDLVRQFLGPYTPSWLRLEDVPKAPGVSGFSWGYGYDSPGDSRGSRIAFFPFSKEKKTLQELMRTNKDGTLVSWNVVDMLFTFGTRAELEETVSFGKSLGRRPWVGPDDLRHGTNRLGVPQSAPTTDQAIAAGLRIRRADDESAKKIKLSLNQLLGFGGTRVSGMKTLGFNRHAVCWDSMRKVYYPNIEIRMLMSKAPGRQALDSAGKSRRKKGEQGTDE